MMGFITLRMILQYGRAKTQTYQHNKMLETQSHVCGRMVVGSIRVVCLYHFGPLNFTQMYFFIYSCLRALM